MKRLSLGLAVLFSFQVILSAGLATEVPEESNPAPVMNESQDFVADSFTTDSSDTEAQVEVPPTTQASASADSVAVADPVSGSSQFIDGSTEPVATVSGDSLLSGAELIQIVEYPSSDQVNSTPEQIQSVEYPSIEPLNSTQEQPVSEISEPSEALSTPDDPSAISTNEVETVNSVPVISDSQTELSSDLTSALPETFIEADFSNPLPEASFETVSSDSSAGEPSLPTQSDTTTNSIESILTTGWVPLESDLTAAAQEATVDEDGNITYGEITVSPVSVSEVETNQQYSQMTFDFTDDETGKQYRCLITGMELSEQNPTEGYDKLAYDIAFSFLNSQSFTLSSLTAEDKYNLTIDLIDAEKESVLEGDDTNLCWAASAADMLEFTGWNQQENEDAAYDQFRDNFNNLGGTQNMAIDWYMDGVNPAQRVTVDGQVLYENTTSGAAQQLTEGTGGFWTDYASASVAPDQGAYENIEGLLSEGTEKLAQGYGLGIGVYTYKGTESQSRGHSLGIFGYISELISQSVEKLAALLISDSDSSASGQTTDREERDNAYSLYQIEEYDNGTIQSLELTDYRSEEDLHTVIGTVTVLEPYESAKESQEKEGSGNSRSDPNLVPVVLSAADANGEALSEGTTGQAIQLQVETWNNSYVKTASDTSAEVVVSVSLDGEVIDSIQQDVSLSDLNPLKTALSSLDYTLEDSGTYEFQVKIAGLKDANGHVIQEAYTSDNELSQTITVIVPEAPANDTPEEPSADPASEETRETDPEEDVSSDIAHSDETDLSDETSTGDSTDETVPGTGSDNSSSAQNTTDTTAANTATTGGTSSQNTSSTGGKKTSSSAASTNAVASEFIWQLYVDITDPETFTLLFQCSAPNETSFSELRELTSKAVVNPEQYAITKVEDGYEITFTDTLLKSLRPGDNDFELLYQKDRVLIRITIL